MTQFPALPNPTTAEGPPRKVGVEIEFAGLSEARVADLAQDHFGGRRATASRHEVVLEDTRLGRLKVELDTPLAKLAGDGLLEAGLDLARPVVPIELITDPLDPAELPRLDRFCDVLRRAGGEGTGHGVLQGFGVHLNVAVVAPDDPHTRRSIRAFALLESWLRMTVPPDRTRRLLPFVAPWPESLIDALVAAPEADLAAQRALYKEHVKSRNHGLDLLPLFKSADPNGYARDFPGLPDIGARPAFHFRLPDCRLDDPDWSLATPWGQWRAVESVADDPEMLATLSDAWRTHRTHFLATRGAWAKEVDRLLAAAGPPLARSLS
jgi:hypothetical protein